MSDKLQPAHLELLKKAGLITTNDQPDPAEIPSPQTGWKSVTNWGNVPLHRIDDTNPDECMNEVNRLWLETARSKNLLGNHDTFLISASSPGPGYMPWTRVRLSEHHHMAQTLIVYPCGPEFVTMSNAGNTIIGVQAEEDGIWIIHEEI